MNTQIKEDYVSFETAKLLKEKGFDEICYLGYNKNGEYIPTSNRTNSQIIQPDFCYICCPTLQMAMKWLRDVRGLNVQPCIVRTIELKKVYNATIYDNHCEQIKSHFGKNIFDGFNSYEEACEAAIKYCLTNLI